MKTFLIAVLGMFVGGILLLVFLWYLIKFLIRHFINKLVKAFEGLAGGGVPPFRITLEKDGDIKWTKADQVDAVTKALEEIGYAQIGDYQIAQFSSLQLDGIRALANTATGSYAVLNGYPSMDVVVDVACFFVGGEHLTVSNAPETGLDRPEFSRMERIALNLAKEPGAAVKLHERMIEEQAGRATVPVSAEAFSKAFRAAYAREMNWRVARGGVTAEEVRRVAALQGQEPPENAAVELVQRQWRTAISDHVDELLRERFLKYITKMSAAEWEEVRDRIYIVHEHSDVEQVIGRLSCAVSTENAVSTASAEPVESANSNGEAAGEALDALFVDDDAERGAEAVLVGGEPDGAIAIVKADECDEDDELDEEERAEAAAEARVRAIFQSRPVRTAFVEAQSLLSPSRRYRKLVGIKEPYGADVYVEPEDAEVKVGVEEDEDD